MSKRKFEDAIHSGKSVWRSEDKDVLAYLEERKQTTKEFNEGMTSYSNERMCNTCGSHSSDERGRCFICNTKNWVSKKLDHFTDRELIDELAKRQGHIKFSVQTMERSDSDPYNPEDHDDYIDFTNHETFEDAEKAFDKALEEEDLYTAQLCLVLKSTD